MQSEVLRPNRKTKVFELIVANPEYIGKRWERSSRNKQSFSENK